ncbi:hypothetical protein [Collibacillus ludicampi]|uniref:hypothetical protein n=1 Tax=Collibacillus ludicampi TaxID=2771369 RepID=UPI0024959ECE|nr:hypothetical protein [Collibacillus ludicampi]
MVRTAIWKQPVHPFSSKNRISSILLAFAGMIVLSFGHPMYETNDDMIMVSLLSGQYGQHAHPDGVFLSLPLSELLYVLYRFNIHIPWYSLTLYLAQWIGCILGYRMILSLTKGLFHKLLMILVFFSLYSFIFLRLNFASTSLFLWCMACLYLAYLNLTRQPAGWHSVLPGCFLGFSYLIRPDIIFVGVCYSFPIWFSFLLPNMKKRFVYMIVPLLLFVSLSSGFAHVMHGSDAYKQYDKFNSVRSSFMDTAMGDFHSGTEEALRKTGWTLDDYRMAKLLWIHDEDIFNSESFQTFLQKNAVPYVSLFSLSKGISAIKGTMGYGWLLLCALFIIMGSNTVAYELPLGKERLIRRLSVLSFLMIIMGIMVLACIRFPNRVAIPLYIDLLGLMVLMKPLFTQKNKGAIAKRMTFVAGLVMILLSLNNYGNLEQQAYVREINKRHFEDSIRLLQQEYRDPLFIHLRINLVADTANPFKEFGDVQHYNMVPASWVIRSPYYYDSLHQYGLSSGKEIVPFSVNNKNAIYIFFESGDYFQFSSFSRYFENHLNTHYASLYTNKRLRIEPVLHTTFQDGDGHSQGWVFFQLKKEDK